MKTALIIGGDSIIGSALHSSLTMQGIACIATRRNDLDLAASPDSWPQLPRVDVAYLCAAMTRLEACENDPVASHLVNVAHMQSLTVRLQENGSFVVFLSSNHVFDGASPKPTTTDAPCPVNAYGRQKAEFEQWLLESKKPAAVLRLTKVISSPLPIIAQWKEALLQGKSIEAFDDLVVAPIPLSAVLQSLQEIGTHKREGIFHLSNMRDISYYEIAQMLAKKLGANPQLVRAISALSKGIPSHFLPKHGTLECSHFDGITIPEPEQIII